MNMKDMTVTELNDYTASKSPVPGGGSISAMAGAFATALVCMVAKLTLGKKGYEETAELMRELDQKGEHLRRELLEDIQKDSESFNGYMAALSMPGDSEEEKIARRRAMQEALKSASNVPLSVAAKCQDVLRLALSAAEKGSPNTASDIMVSVLMARAALLGAVSNVRINLGGIKDEAFVQDMEDKCKALETQANQQEAAARSILDMR